MRTRLSILCAAVSSLLLAGLSRADNFTPPKDGKFTEKQLTNLIAARKDQMDALHAAGAAASGTNSTTANMAIMSNASKKIDDAITAHGLTKPEFDWLGGVVDKCWPIALVQQQWDDTGKPDLEKQVKAHTDDEAANQTKLAAAQQAEKDGKRVLTKDQHDAAVTSATSDRDSIAAEVKTDTDALKPINDEITQHEKDAADAEALAKNPPADVTADDRSSYIDGKKNEAQTAHDAAKDSRDHLAEVKKTLDDAQTRLTSANAKVDHPEVPLTDDEKTQARADNEQAITEAKAAISDDEQAITALKEALAAGPLPAASTDAKDRPDPDNLALVKKHLKEYLDAIGAGAMLKTK